MYGYNACMGVCMYICVCMSTCVYVCMSIRVCMCMYACVRASNIPCGSIRVIIRNINRHFPEHAEPHVGEADICAIQACPDVCAEMGPPSYPCTRHSGALSTLEPHYDPHYDPHYEQLSVHRVQSTKLEAVLHEPKSNTFRKQSGTH